MDAPFIIRSVRDSDLDQLHRLSQMVYFINLPDDREILEQKIRLSIQSFNGEIEDKFAREYILVMENPEDNSILGTSMVIARHGSPSSPHMYLQLRELHKYSETIHFGLIHKVLRLRFDADGPTEIGGLVINPNYRKHKDKLGRQLSYARFLFIKMKRRSFKNHILSELMPPLTDSGESVLWEALGRRFTGLSYEEADMLSRKNKEFVTSLFPQEDIYTCLLSGEARDAIGKVGKGAEPVKHMLESIGFRWKEHIDPFDGGPHYWAETDKISIIHNTKKVKIQREPLKKRGKTTMLLGSFADNEFRAVQTGVELARGGVRVHKSVLEAMQLSAGDPVYVMPIESPSQQDSH